MSLTKERFVGSIVSSGAVRGALNHHDNTTWILPTWLQLMLPSMIVVLVWFLPESPRWLYVHGQVDKAEEILINFHGNGDRNSVWVCMQLDDFNSCLKNDGADKRWWDYRALFRDRASVYRLACNCIVSVFGQWAGNGKALCYPSNVRRMVLMLPDSCDILFSQCCPRHCGYHQPP